jgi:dTDP-4-amino-4,6-dideoxygalactose transaminase
MSLKIPFAKVDCSGNELKYIQEVLNSGWLTTAGKAQLLEKKFLKYVGGGHRHRTGRQGVGPIHDFHCHSGSGSLPWR